MADRLRKARISAGYASASAAAEAFGWQPSAYRHHENGTRQFDVTTAQRYARALKVSPGWLLALDAVQPATPEVEEAELIVLGSVAAGVWLEQSQWPEDMRYSITVGPSPVAGGERFAVQMDGYSMDKIIPPGSVLECLRVSFGLVEPAAGDLVIVERVAHDLTEMTCKRLDRDGDKWILRAESSRPEFAKPIEIGNPSADDHVDNGVNVIGIVLKAHQQHYRPRRSNVVS